MVFGVKVFNRPMSTSRKQEATDVEDCIPLANIPSSILDAHPELKLRSYNIARVDVCSNAIAMPHNASRVEMADMWGLVIPYLRTRMGQWTDSDIDNVTDWWGGFTRFALTTSMVDDLVMEMAYKDILIDYDASARTIGAAVRKLKDRNGHTLVRAARAMDRALSEFRKTRTETGFVRVVSAWGMVTSIICDTYETVENTLDTIDAWRKDQLAVHKGLEKKIAAVYTSRKRWSDDYKRGEMVVILTRWVGCEDATDTWLRRNLANREARSVQKWFNSYNSNRHQLLETFRG